MEIKLRPYQEEAIQQLRIGLSRGHKNQLLCAPTGAGKCLGKDTPVMLADGSIKMVQDVVVGDRLLGPDGKARNVLSTTSGREKLYKIIPKKGDPYVVNASHILSLKKTPGSDGMYLSDGTHIGKNDDIVNVNVEVFANSNATVRHCLKGWRSNAVSFERNYNDIENAIFIPPYIFGAWLGDGVRRNEAICKPPCRMIGAFRKYARLLGTDIYNDEKRPGFCPRWKMKKSFLFRNAIDIYMGSRKEKFIPDAYKYASQHDRLQLIAGMIDSDGSVSNNVCDWISKSEQMAKDFAFVCRSLGLSCYLSKQVKRIKETGFSGEYWRASVSGDLSIIPTKDKIFGKRKQKKRTQVHSIQIQDIGEGDYYGFEIDGDRLFLLGDFTVTHNTVLAAYLIQKCYKKTKRCAFVVDRNVLVDQTSEVFATYGIPHGIIQADHPLYRPYERVQIISAQTMERRKGIMDDFDLIIVDECHTVRKATTEILMQRNCPAIGLTATPFSKGLGRIYDNLVNVTTTDSLIEGNFLSDYSVYSCPEPDMTGVKIANNGEWAVGEASGRSIDVVGDVVKTYLDKAFGRKFICSAVDTKHVEALKAQFQEAGIMCASFTYRTTPEERREIVTEFRKPDSFIRGLITVTAATKGFDVADVDCVIMARPLRKALAEHIQLLGRGLRPFPGKGKCIVLDHAGNCRRFWGDMLYFFANGASTLDEKEKKWQKAVQEEEKEERSVKCSNCDCLYKAKLPYCPECGMETPRAKTDIIHTEGELVKLQKEAFLSKIPAVEIQRQIKRYVMGRNSNKKESMYIAIYKTATGKFPKKKYWDVDPADHIDPGLMKIIIHNNIKYAKRRAAA